MRSATREDAGSPTAAPTNTVDFSSLSACSSIFAANLAKIEAHNSGDHSWKMGECAAAA